MLNDSKTQFFHQSTRHNIPDNYPLFFNDTELFPSSTLNYIEFAHNLSWKPHFSSHAKTASIKLDVLRGLLQFLPPLQLQTL
ncbi:hypothetical protein E2C01_058096 [Portunus trituberculatus]|uniref:Uncharacterized protein n=1 Tax=Portunus trituberculatus TaxID=210409 RepID=A0A5B7H3S5_PORTR|nr:hypothetical protein [Portunus trituberculatus]